MEVLAANLSALQEVGFFQKKIRQGSVCFSTPIYMMAHSPQFTLRENHMVMAKHPYFFFVKKKAFHSSPPQNATSSQSSFE